MNITDLKPSFRISSNTPKSEVNNIVPSINISNKTTAVANDWTYNQEELVYNNEFTYDGMYTYDIVTPSSVIKNIIPSLRIKTM